MSLYRISPRKFIDYYNQITGSDYTVMSVVVLGINCEPLYSTYIEIRDGQSLGLTMMPDTEENEGEVKHSFVNTDTGHSNVPSGQEDILDYLFGLGLLPPDLS